MRLAIKTSTIMAPLAFACLSVLACDWFSDAPAAVPPSDAVSEAFLDVPTGPSDVSSEPSEVPLDVAAEPDAENAADVGGNVDTEPDIAVDVDTEPDVEVGVQDVAVDTAGDSDGGEPPADLTPEPELDVVDATDVAPCALDEDCGFGFRCREEICLELECHLGLWSADPGEAIPDKPCPVGQICDVLLEEEPTYTCVPFERSCDFPSDCPFGFRCESAVCVLSGCTVGNMDAGYGPRPCQGEGEFCGCMEDGADINGGRGVCVTDYGECP